ncbi:MAG: cytochrome P450 [Chloroflexota bacterium]
MSDNRMDSCPVNHTSPAAELNLLHPDFIKNPYALFKHARAEEPIFYSPETDMWVITRYDDLKTVMKDVGHFSSEGAFTAAASVSPEAFRVLGGLDHPMFRYSAINVDPPLHKRLRASLQKAFSPRQTALLEPQIRQLIHQLIDDFGPVKQAEFMQNFCNPLPLRTICRLLGVPDTDAAKVSRWSAYLVAIQIPGQSPEQQRTLGNELLNYYRYVLDLVGHYKQNPAENLISSMLASQQTVEEPLSDEEIAGLMCNVVLAGHETTEKLLGNMLHNVLHQRELWTYLCEHSANLAAAVDEFIRHDTSVMGLYRRTTQAVQIGNVTIPANATVWVAYAAGNHDPGYFPEPEVIDFQRANAGENLTFGYGIHYCVGASLTKLEVRLVLEELTKRLTSLRLVPDQPFEFIPHFVLRSYQELFLEWD